MATTYRKTRIICTLGPASESDDMVETLINSGTDVFRLNFSHGSYEQHSKMIDKIRRISKRLNRHVGILQDLQGPKIRIGKVIESGIALKNDDKLIITTDSCLGETGRVSTTYQSLPTDVKKGDLILVDDGLIQLKVIKIVKNDVHTVVTVGGQLTSNKGLNLPNVKLSTPALTEKDHEDLLFGINNDIDFIALSFVRSAEDIRKLKAILAKHNRNIPIIAKIEKPEAVADIKNIIKETYGIMVARGDLGVELKTEDVPTVQKEITKLCNKMGKPVIIATQMLDSMIRNPRPTRAEASDVANAVLDGADALMLSGETAAGLYPIEAMNTMRNVIKSTELAFMTKEAREAVNRTFDLKSISEVVCYSAVNVARNVNAKLIACVTHTGQTAAQIARFKSHLPVLAITDDPMVPRKMSLNWGVRTIVIDRIENTETCFIEMEQMLEESQYLEENDIVVFTAGMPTLARNSTNMIKVHKIKKGVSKLL
jgi:pyruvate kinase